MDGKYSTCTNESHIKEIRLVQREHILGSIFGRIFAVSKERSDAFS